MRVFTASLATETNTFSPMVTAMADLSWSALSSSYRFARYQANYDRDRRQLPSPHCRWVPS